MDDTLTWPLAVPAEELVERRRRTVAAFLASRTLEPGPLAAFMRERVGDGTLLLTSSPVHGLANATSDLDFIRVQADAIAGPRISTKIFDRGEHLEVVSFSADEVAGNVAELARLAAAPFGESVVALRAWDQRREPRRKQTERIVNGLTLDGEAPYLGHLPALATLWSRSALHTAVEHAVCLALAERAGERRGRVGYATNLLLHLMDAVLSAHGDVYSTRKWYLLRWQRHTASGRWLDDEHRRVGQEIDRLRAGLRGALTADPSTADAPTDGVSSRGAAGAVASDDVSSSGAAGAVALDGVPSNRATGAIAPDHVRLVARVAALTGAGDVRVRIVPTDEQSRRLPFLPGSDVLLAAGRALVLASDAPTELGPLDLAQLPDVDPGAATDLLRALRAGVAAVHVDDRGGDR